MASSVDVVTFIRESMVRICAGLELDVAVMRCLEYMGQHLPVEQVLVTARERTGEFAVIWATAQGVRPNPGQVSTAEGWGERLGWGERVVLMRRLTTSGGQLGAVYFVAADGQGLGPVELQMLAQLDGAFTAALSNHLQHLEALQRVASEPAPAPDSAVLDQLEPILARALALCRNAPLGPEADLPAMPEERPALDLDQVVANHIRLVLRQVGGRVEGRAGAAELLGVNPSTLRKRMRKLKIPFGRKARAAG